MVTLLLSTDPELLWKSYILLQGDCSQSIIVSVSSSTYSHFPMFTNLLKIHCLNPHSFSVGIYNLCFYTVIPLGCFIGMKVDKYVYPVILNNFMFGLKQN